MTDGGQLTLFGDTTLPSTSILGLRVSMADRPCRCGSINYFIGPGKAMHHASLTCSRCDRDGGWMSQTSFGFVGDIVGTFGRPDQPIVVRRSTQ